MVKKSIKKHIQIFLFCIAIIGSQSFPVFAQTGEIGSIGSEDYKAEELKLDDDSDVYKETAPPVKDPFEKYNRFMFNVNDKIYKHLLNPIAKTYDFFIPKKVQGSLNNFIGLISTPVRFFNNLFQKKFRSARIEAERLLINSTLGIGGLFDPADRVFKLKQQTEDFGQTLGVYGVKSGPYIVWPIIGPSTLRDSFGTIVDMAFDPLTWLGIYDVEPEDGFVAIRGVRKINNYAYTLRGAYKRITDTAIDSYMSVQYTYIQYRNKKIKE